MTHDLGSRHEPGHHRDGVVHFDGDGTVRLRERAVDGVVVHLVGGRDRYSVGGSIKEGPRWWRGRLDWPDGEEPPIGTEVVIELRDGRAAPAVIELDPSAPARTAAVHGVGPPPFDVP